MISFLVTGVWFTEALFPVLRSGEWNDDSAARPLLHGAYEVMDNVTSKSSQIKRFFIHRDGYFILSDGSGKMQDYKLDMATENHLILTDYNSNSSIISYSYDAVQAMLRLVFKRADLYDTITGKELNWKELPLIKDEFHWTVD